MERFTNITLGEAISAPRGGRCTAILERLVMELTSAFHPLQTKDHAAYLPHTSAVPADRRRVWNLSGTVLKTTASG